jgi:hypothetical protein
MTSRTTTTTRNLFTINFWNTATVTPDCTGFHKCHSDFYLYFYFYFIFYSFYFLFIFYTATATHDCIVQPPQEPLRIYLALILKILQLLHMTVQCFRKCHYEFIHIYAAAVTYDCIV